MDFYSRLIASTAAERADFLAIPVLQRALAEGVPLELYLAFLGQAYHHVKHTCPLLEAAAAKCGPADEYYRTALETYVDEERGHERWILDDIAALGGNAAAVAQAQPGVPCRLLVAYVYFAIGTITPYAMLGMVHVLEGMSVALAQAGANALKRSLDLEGDVGFSYLTSHGALDQDHVAFFRDLVNRVEQESDRTAIVETAQVVYRLYGDIFRSLDTREQGVHCAA